MNQVIEGEIAPGTAQETEKQIAQGTGTDTETGKRTETEKGVGIDHGMMTMMKGIGIATEIVTVGVVTTTIDIETSDQTKIYLRKTNSVEK